MMAKLNYVQVDEDDHLNSYYITLCHVYYFNVSEDNSEKEKLQAEGTIETLSSLIFHAINIEGTTIREMEISQYEREYKRFYNDIMMAIKECTKNGIEYDDFLLIMDEIVGAAISLARAFEKLETVKESTSEEELVEIDIETSNEEEEG
jgi:hypothetical protein